MARELSHFPDAARAPSGSHLALGDPQDVQPPLPIFVGPIPTPRPASQRPVRRDGGEETELKILTRGVPEQIMIEGG